jgi:hypothetical protein
LSDALSARTWISKGLGSSDRTEVGCALHCVTQKYCLRLCCSKQSQQGNNRDEGNAKNCAATRVAAMTALINIWMRHNCSAGAVADRSNVNENLERMGMGTSMSWLKVTVTLASVLTSVNRASGASALTCSSI